jgi:hypothetical protein
MPQSTFLEILQDGPVSKAISRDGGLKESQDYTLIDLRGLIQRLAHEFPESAEKKDGVLFRIGDLASFEIDLISGTYTIDSSISGLQEFPKGDSGEFNQIISGLRKLVRMRNKMLTMDFMPTQSGADEGKYRMVMIRSIISSNVDEIIAEIKSFRAIMESIK